MNPVGFLVEVLIADEVPGNHEAKHEKAPEERDKRPGQFHAGDRFVPPIASFW
jgi:hypothetical protein